jgi:hypothetical protein
VWCVFVWCSVLAFELVLTLGVYCILLLYYILYYTYTIIHILLFYLILYSSVLPSNLSSSILFSSLLPLQSSSSFPHSPPPHLSSINSFYTCRYLHILIYIPFFPNQQFDPARSIGVDVSSGVVLFVWCSVLVEGYLAFELVDGLRLGGIILLYYYILLYIHYYIIHYYYTISYTILLLFLF